MDEKTGEGIPYASVYFAGTTLGGATLEDGSYEIKNIPNGRYDLIVSAIGFKRFKQPVEIQSSNSVVNVSLAQDPIALSEIVITADQSDRKYLPLFKKYFLGQTDNSKRCTIRNPQDLIFYFDDKTRVLVVHASKPIIVDNKALGYRLHYSLDFFEYDFNTAVKKLQGITRFEEFKMNHQDSMRYETRRRIAYKGSLIHFMRSLYNDSLEEGGFYVSVVDSSRLNESIRVDSLLDTRKFLSGDKEKKFTFKGRIRLEFKHEGEEWDYRHNRRFVPQRSYIFFQDPSITIFENGYFVRQMSLRLFGYYGYSEVIAEIVPFGYTPKEK